MNLCVIADDDRLASRIGTASTAAGLPCLAGQTIHFDAAETYLTRHAPDVVIAAVGSDFDSAVRMVTRLRQLVAGHFVAVGPASDPRFVLAALRGGAVDYVDESAVESELAPAVARLKTPRSGRTAPGRLIAVVAPSGGCGASLIAANLAVAIAKVKERCLLLDLKWRSGDLASWLDLKPSHTMQDLCRVASRIDQTLFEQTISKHGSGVSLLASPRSFETTIPPDALPRVIELGRMLFPRILADVDPSLTEEMLEVLKLADHVLIPLRLEFNALRNARAMLEHLERRGVDPKKILLIANRVGQPKEIAVAKAEEALGRKFFTTVPDDSKAALGSQNNGVPAMIEYPSSYLSKALRSLATAIDNVIPISNVA